MFSYKYNFVAPKSTNENVFWYKQEKKTQNNANVM